MNSIAHTAADSTGAALRIGLACLLAIVTFALFAPSAGNPFVMYDDPVYVTDNPHVVGGLSGEGLLWALTSREESNWHPLTWLSHMADVQFFGVRPGPHRLVNVLLHSVNVALLFWLLSGTTGRPWPSAFVAAVFGLHPLRVESVVWIAERKDVLSTLFALVAVLAYVAWTRRPAWPRYALVVLAFAAALLSKPMTVTLPGLLFLVDLWPLGRIEGADRTRVLRLLLEKAPLFGMSLGVALVTFLAQRAGGATNLLGALPIGVRMGNAVVAPFLYLGKFLWPTGLAVIYPYPATGRPLWAVAAAGAGLIALTALAVRWRRRAPWFAFGWGVLLVGLLPVLGIVQAGAQALADRYTYFPLVGPAVALAWGAATLAAAGRGRRLAAGVAGALAVGACVPLTVAQIRTWRSDEALFAHAVAVTRDNWIAHHNLALAYARTGRLDACVAEDREAIRLCPGYSELHKFWSNLAFCLGRLGRLPESAEALREVLRLDPGNVSALNDLGALLGRRGDLAAALEHFARAVLIVPNDAKLRANYAFALVADGRPRQALEQLRIAVRIDPADPLLLARLRQLETLAGPATGAP